MSDRVLDSILPQHIVKDGHVIVRVGKKRCAIFDVVPYLRVTLRDNQLSYDQATKQVMVNETMFFDRNTMHYHNPNNLSDAPIIHLNEESRDCRMGNLCYEKKGQPSKGLYTSADFLKHEKGALELWK